MVIRVSLGDEANLLHVVSRRDTLNKMLYTNRQAMVTPNDSGVMDLMDSLLIIRCSSEARSSPEHFFSHSFPADNISVSAEMKPQAVRRPIFSL